ncbi:MAG: TrkH family potassium uptake protein [Tannerella sp.]|jgi:trk system potassium uptake protein TrkH|nr:TrkH family potassium uptake protein [Tannerella sp.]
MSRINLRFVCAMLGKIHLLESVFMLPAVVVAWLCRETDLCPLLLSSGIMLAAGGLFLLAGRGADRRAIGRREGMLTVALTWTLLSFFGMMPLFIGGYVPNMTDAYFESMSGFTTTGATILTDVEALPHGILFWRSLMQWQGGIGIIVCTAALMPAFGGTVSQLFDAETSGITHEHFLPRVTQIAKRFFGLYLGLTLLLILLLRAAGPMSLFDAVNHALTTVSSGGYSTRNAGISHWHQPGVEYLLCFFMCLSATNITLLYFLIRRQWKKALGNTELRWFYTLTGVAVAITFAWLFFRRDGEGAELIFRKSLFQVTSLISTTGFRTADISTWGPFFTVVALFLMTVCGCAGSTSGGLKTGRFLILVKNMLNEFKRQMHPNAVISVRLREQVIPALVVQRVQTFAFVYMALLVAGCAVFLLDGLAFEDALGVTVSAISNIGPALGRFADGDFHALPLVSKWVYSFLMLTGRLEIFTVLTLLLPGFWKR